MTKLKPFQENPTARRMKGPDGIILEIDTADAATPAMVYDLNNDSLSATYDCAMGEGVLNGRYDGDVELSGRALEWLAKFEDDVERAYEIARKDHPDYQ